jgi:hypothetical protein
MLSAGLAMLGLALAAIVMVLVAAQRDGGADRDEQRALGERRAVSPTRSPVDAEPGSRPDPMPASGPSTGRAASA